MVFLSINSTPNPFLLQAVNVIISGRGRFTLRQKTHCLSERVRPRVSGFPYYKNWGSLRGKRPRTERGFWLHLNSGLLETERLGSSENL